MSITDKDRAELAALYSAYRRAFGRTSLQALLVRHGIDESLDALDQQDKFKALHRALMGELSPDAVTHAKACAAKSDGEGSDADIDDGEGVSASASAAAKPRAFGEIHDAAYQNWNKKRPARASGGGNAREHRR